MLAKVEFGFGGPMSRDSPMSLQHPVWGSANSIRSMDSIDFSPSNQLEEYLEFAIFTLNKPSDKTNFGGS